MRHSDEELEVRVPEGVYRLTLHYHNLIYIKNYWESIGQQLDPSLNMEIQRAHAELLLELESERGQGGRLRREDETRKSEQRPGGRVESRAEGQGSQPEASQPNRV